MKVFYSILAFCIVLTLPLRAQTAIDPKEFRHPPKQFAVGTWWHWINGNISKEGITKDLDAMAEQGISYATLFDVSMGPGGTVPMLTPKWFEMVSHAAAEARRTGVKLGLHVAPGWSELGGPWIPVEQSMKRLVWGQALVTGGENIEMDLPPLPEVMKWSKDVAVLALPVSHPASRMNACTAVTSNGDPVQDNMLWDGNPATGPLCKKDEYKWTFGFEFPAPHKADHLRLQTRWLNHFPPSENIRVIITGDGATLVDTEMKGRQLANALVVPFPSASAKAYSVEVILPRTIQSWTTFKFMQFTEAELLDGKESPQWHPGVENLAQQIGDLRFAEADASKPLIWAESPRTALDPSKIIDLSANVIGKKLSWKAPAGNWRIVRFGYTTTGVFNTTARHGGIGFESDKMSASASELGFCSYIDKILDAAGPNRSMISKIIIDSWEAGMQNWTDDFPQAFQQRRGYSILPHLAVFAGEVVGSKDETERFLNDFRRTISDLVVERFYGKIGELCHARGLRYAAELAEGGPILDYFAGARVLDEPMNEFWSDRWDGTSPLIPDPIRTSIVPDAARLAGKPLVGAEAFTSSSADFRKTPGDYIYVAGVEFSKGYNSLVLHSFVHQPSEKPPGFTLGRHGQAFNRLNTWWPMIGDWLLSLQRFQYIAQSSTPVSDVLVYCGDALPGPKDVNGLPKGARRLRIDHEALMKRVAMKDGKLTLDGTGNYAAILFPSGQLFAETVEKMQSLATEGAVLGVTIPFHNPSWSDHDAQDRRFAAAAKILIGQEERPVLPRDVGKGRVHSLADLNALFREFRPDFDGKPNGTGRPLLSYRTKHGDADIYLLINANDESKVFNCSVDDPTGRVPEIWDPMTGDVGAISGAVYENGILRFDLGMQSKGEVFLVLRDKEASVPFLPHFETPRELPLSAVWSVTFPGLPNQAPVRMEALRSWTESDNPAIRSYSGLAVYRASIVLPHDSLKDAKAVRLDLGAVGKVARVTVNGKVAGTLWHSPWSIDVSGLIREGDNALSIEVANSWLNQMLQDLSRPSEERKTWTTWNTDWWKDRNVAAEASGLLAEPKLVLFRAADSKQMGPGK